MGDGEQGPLDSHAYLLQHIGDLKRRLQRAHQKAYEQRKRAEHWKRVALRKPVKRAS